MKNRKSLIAKQLEILDNMGEVANIINDEELLIILLEFDDYILYTLFEKVNLAIRDGEIIEDDLQLFRSGWLGKQIMKLSQNSKNRNQDILYREISQKLSSLSYIDDVPTLIASYTNPLVIKAVGEYDAYDEINYWIYSGTFNNLPIEVSLNICIKLIEAGYIQRGKNLLKCLSADLEYSRELEPKVKKKVDNAMYS